MSFKMCAPLRLPPGLTSITRMPASCSRPRHVIEQVMSVVHIARSHDLGGLECSLRHCIELHHFQICT